MMKWSVHSGSRSPSAASASTDSASSSNNANSDSEPQSISSDSLKIERKHKGHYRRAVALQGMGRYADSLASYCAGLGRNPQSGQLMQGLVETALGSPLAEKFSPIYDQLRHLALDSNAFVLAAVTGQELLSAGFEAPAVMALEAALQIGSCSLKLRGSVASALSRAYWALGKIDRALVYMQQDLQISKELGDVEGECRAAGNLGSAFFCRRQLSDALANQRLQLELATRLHDRRSAILALSNLGHTHTALSDFPNAISSHKQAALLCRQVQDPLGEAHEISNLGAVYLSMGQADLALDCYREQLRIAAGEKAHVERGQALCCLGNAHLWKREYDLARSCFREAMQVAGRLADVRARSVEGRACAGLGQCARSAGDFKLAKQYHQRQLDCALTTKDKVMEARACSSLGIIYHQFGEYENAIKLHKAHLKLAMELEDRAAEGRAYGNIGNGYSALEQFHLAISFHQKELAISKEVEDKRSQCATHGNLAVAFQAVHDMSAAERHHEIHFQMSRELKDRASESRALNNLGNFRCCQGQYEEALKNYEAYRQLAQEIGDLAAEGAACHKMGYVCYALGRYEDAIRYYEQDVTLAQKLGHELNSMRAHCNLGLAYKQAGNFESALRHQETFLRLATANTEGQFKALGNIGDLYLDDGRYDDAVDLFQRQMGLAEQSQTMPLLALAHSNLGAAYERSGDLTRAGRHYQRELELCRSLEDLQGECRALGHVGSVQLGLGHLEAAFRLFDSELARAHQLHGNAAASWRLRATACGHLGQMKAAAGELEAAVGFLQQQLAILEGCGAVAAATWFLKERAECYQRLADCHTACGDREEAVRCLDRLLPICQKTGDFQGQITAYRGLASNHRAMGHLSQALVCLEKCLMLAHESNRSECLAAAYGELGLVHMQMSNFEQSLSCLQHQHRLAKQSGDQMMESDAASGLGRVYQLMSEFSKALEFHETDLRLAEAAKRPSGRCRALGNLAGTYEAMGDLESALHHRQLHLTAALEAEEARSQLEAYSGLGRVHHEMGSYQSAIHYLYQGLNVCEGMDDCREEEARIQLRLGMSLWSSESLEDAQNHMLLALDLFDTVRRDMQHTMDYKLDLFDQQTACYQSLQRVMVCLDDEPGALAVAERGRTRALLDLLLERRQEGNSGWSDGPSEALSYDQMTDLVDRECCHCLYFSLAAGFLYVWLLAPREGLVKFHAVDLATLAGACESAGMPSEVQSVSSLALGALDSVVARTREVLGVESGGGVGSSALSINSSVCTSSLNPLEEDEDESSISEGRPAFLRFLNRDDVCNRSTRSLISSSASFSSLSTLRLDSTLPSPLPHLHQHIIAPFEGHLPTGPSANGAVPRLILVLQGDLHLLPFTALRPAVPASASNLGERFALTCVPSLSALAHAHALNDTQNKETSRASPSRALVVGNPQIPLSVTERWRWANFPNHTEGRTVAELLSCRPIVGAEASKSQVLDAIPGCEVLHFSVPIVWRLSGLVLSPGPGCSSTDPALPDFLLSASEILTLDLRSCRLVVLSPPPSSTSASAASASSRPSADGLLGLSRSFLAAGAQCVLTCLWAMPEAATRHFLRAFYGGLQKDMCVSEALNGAVRTMREAPHFAKPALWAGWMALGRDSCLSSRAALMGHALGQILLQSASCGREQRLRVMLHLMEKALQRLRLRGSHRAPPLYTPLLSIAQRMGRHTAATGEEETEEEAEAEECGGSGGGSEWRALLQAVGFRFDILEAEEVVFFPSSDPANRLSQCSACLQAQLSLPGDILKAMGQVLQHSRDCGHRLLTIVRQASAGLSRAGGGTSGGHTCSVSAQLWRTKGCHEFLASLGFDLMEIAADEVRLQCGKNTNRRHLQMALTILLAVFETQATPRQVPGLESASSMESLTNSSDAGASPSDSGEPIPHDSSSLPLHSSLTARVLSVDEPLDSAEEAEEADLGSRPASGIDDDRTGVQSAVFHRCLSRASTCSSTLTGDSSGTLTSGVRHRPRVKERSAPRTAERYSLSPGPVTSAPPPQRPRSSIASSSNVGDPTQLALRVLADTQQQMAAVDAMQQRVPGANADSPTAHQAPPSLPDPTALLIFSASALYDEALYEHQLSTITEVSDSEISAMSLPAREPLDVAGACGQRPTPLSPRGPLGARLARSRAPLDLSLKDSTPSVASNSSGYSSTRDFAGNASSGSDQDSEGQTAALASPPPTSRGSTVPRAMPRMPAPPPLAAAGLHAEIRASPTLKDYMSSRTERDKLVAEASGAQQWRKRLSNCVLKASDC